MPSHLLALSACALACASSRPRPTPASAPALIEAAEEPSDATAAAPEVDLDERPPACQGDLVPLDRAGRALLERLEREIASQALGAAPPAHPLFNLADVRSALRDEPTAEVVFVFPLAVPLPMTVRRARLASSTAGLRHAPHTVIYIELANVRQVGQGQPSALVLELGAGPTGTPPPNTTWLWGLWAPHCVALDHTGHWTDTPFGMIVVSENEDPSPTARRLAG